MAPHQPWQTLKVYNRALPLEVEWKTLSFWRENRQTLLVKKWFLLPSFWGPETLWSPTSWLDDRIMDVAQKLICKELGVGDY